MRFDDSLETVLSAEMSSSFGAQSAWRQLVDLIGRGRAPASEGAIARLEAIRADVPPPVRAASARALAEADPPFALVRLFAADEVPIAAPVLRVARLSVAQWIDLLPGLSPAARSVVRHRRDLPEKVVRYLEGFGSTDFILPGVVVPPEEPQSVIERDIEVAQPPLAQPAAEAATPVAPLAPLAIDWTEMLEPEPVAFAAPDSLHQAIRADSDVVADDPIVFSPPLTIDWTELLPPQPTNPLPAEVLERDRIDGLVELSESLTVGPEPADEAPIVETEETGTGFVSIASVALGLPVVAEALRQSGRPDATSEQRVEAVGEVAESGVKTALPPSIDASAGPFQIADLVARIDAYHRARDEAPARALPELQPELFELEPARAATFRFETDAAGIVRWIEGAARAPLIGLSLDLAALPSGSRVDGVAAGAFRRRAGFANARLLVDGTSDAAGQWRITGIPVFDRASGRFTGYRGTARRPRADETAEPSRAGRGGVAADGLRQLVHELRTPTNAIAGFAEMIERQMLGPVPQVYRTHAASIRTQAGDLLTAIDDIDLAARIEADALDLRTGEVPVEPLLRRVVADLAPLAQLRGTTIELFFAEGGLTIAGDDRAVERLVARLMATLVASGGAGERIGVAATHDAEGPVALAFDRPATLARYEGDALLSIDAEDAERDGAPLLGTGFALRLARNLAVELSGSLVIGERTLTLRLPAAVIDDVEQAFSS